MLEKHIKFAVAAYHHAEEHYDDKGIRWDYVVETQEIKSMAKELAMNGVTSKSGAIAYFKEFAKMMHEAESNCREY